MAPPTPEMVAQTEAKLAQAVSQNSDVATAAKRLNASSEAVVGSSLALAKATKDDGEFTGRFAAYRP